MQPNTDGASVTHVRMKDARPMPRIRFSLGGQPQIFIKTFQAAALPNLAVSDAIAPSEMDEKTVVQKDDSVSVSSMKAKIREAQC